MRCAFVVCAFCVAGSEIIMAKPITPSYIKDCNSQYNGEQYCIVSNLSESPFDSKDAAAWDVAQTIMKNRECRREWESTYLIYEKNGKYYHGTPQFYSDKTYGKQHAPVDLDHEYVQGVRNNGYNVVAAIHPHPSGSWFSMQDAKMAKRNSIDCYLLPCSNPKSINRYNNEQPNIYVLDHAEGMVYPIVRGRRVGGMLKAPGDYYGMEGMYQGVAQYARLNSVQGSNGMNENAVADDVKDKCRYEAMCIDTSKLEALQKEQISFVKALLAKGEKATQDEIDTYNSRQKKMAQELIGIAGKINSMATSKEDVNRIAERELGNLIPLAEQLKRLVGQVVEKKIVDHLESMSLNDLNSTGFYQSSSDDSCCACQVPESRIVVPPAGGGWATCTKCGKFLGTVVNGRIISTNPAVNGKSIK